eukprot:4907339-Prymnesium_polylepis.1
MSTGSGKKSSRRASERLVVRWSTSSSGSSGGSLQCLRYALTICSADSSSGICARVSARSASNRCSIVGVDMALVL